MIRILHTADWHLGQTFFGYDRTGEHEVFLNWLAEEIRQKEIDALIIAGDVFDVSNPSAASQSMYYQFIYRVTVENPNLQIVIVAGNHDSAARLEAPLPLLQAMRTEVRAEWAMALSRLRKSCSILSVVFAARERGIKTKSRKKNA